jgi:hypothetical protein
MTLSVRGTPSASGGDEFDPRIQDSAFLEEIDLYSELIIVAAASTGTLSADTIDRALGLRLVTNRAGTERPYPSD